MEVPITDGYDHILGKFEVFDAEKFKTALFHSNCVLDPTFIVDSSGDWKLLEVSLVPKMNFTLKSKD